MCMRLLDSVVKMSLGIGNAKNRIPKKREILAPILATYTWFDQESRTAFLHLVKANKYCSHTLW